jgi:hypothetical protein
MAASLLAAARGLARRDGRSHNRETMALPANPREANGCDGKMAQKRHRGGRPERSINLAELEKLCALQCTQAEIADWFGVGSATIERRLRQPEYREVMERGYARGRISLRRKQMQLAEQGNPAMLIWLGKQYLGQRDSIDQTIGASGGAPFQIEIVRVVARSEVGTEAPAAEPVKRLN